MTVASASSDVGPREAGRQSANVGAAAAQLLFQQHRQRIFAYCLSRLRDRQEAEDAVQTTFLYAYVSLNRGVVPRVELAWLFTIARNVCRSRRRSIWRRGRVETTTDFGAIQDELGALDQATDELWGLSEALTGMPTSQRQALLLREWQGLSYAEIADRLSLSQAAVETLLFRARRALASRLEPTANKVAVLLNLAAVLKLVRRLGVGGINAKAATAAVAVSLAAGGGVSLERSLTHQQRSSRPASSPRAAPNASSQDKTAPNAPDLDARLRRGLPTRGESGKARPAKAAPKSQSRPALAPATPKTEPERPSVPDSTTDQAQATTATEATAQRSAREKPGLVAGLTGRLRLETPALPAQLPTLTIPTLPPLPQPDLPVPAAIDPPTPTVTTTADGLTGPDAAAPGPGATVPAPAAASPAVPAAGEPIGASVPSVPAP